MTTSRLNLTQIGIATLVVFGATIMAATSTADAKQHAQGKRHRVMQKYDTNGDGVLGPMERALMINSRVNRLFGKLDLNRDGRIGPLESRKASKRMIAVLKSADKNGNGFVTKGELRFAMTQRWNSKKGKEPWGKKHNGQKSWKEHQKGKKPGAKGHWDGAPKGAKLPPANVRVRDHRMPSAPKSPAKVRDHRKPSPVKKAPVKKLTVGGKLALRGL
jgi:hypothetical protein